MPTLLSINNYYYRRGGAEAVFLDHNDLFAELNWDIVPFCMQHPSNLPSPWSPHFVEEIEFGAQYSVLQKLVRVPKVIYSLEARRKLDSLLSKIKPDVCHAHNIYHHISPSILGLLKRRGIPTFLTLHDLKIACPAYKMLSHDGVCERCKNGQLFEVVKHRCLKSSLGLSAIAYLEAVVNRSLRSYQDNVHRFVVPSRFYIQKLIDWGWDPAHFAHVPNFVRAKDLQPDYTPGRKLLYFGRLGHEKGLHTLIRACALTKAGLRIVGTGPEEASLRALAATLGTNVEFAGYKTGKDLYDEVRMARAVVLPSEWYENAPISLMEGYALGKPAIGARIGGITEMIREDETGKTFVSGDADSLAEAISEFLNLPDSRLEEMGRLARQWMEADFSPDAYRGRILALYQEAARIPLS
ncbi:glycosyltransferase family 4 protein [Methyloterricola oryzae]|uniref:glycosyltransferase family 4 protein n=1 Tax=Methyloterricola oryzae TaxID=1495050 RepID=UPI0005EB350B|nr:glycosyltransferase family 4 protein [Methyloterricola oryzae]